MSSSKKEQKMTLEYITENDHMWSPSLKTPTVPKPMSDQEIKQLEEYVKMAVSNYNQETETISPIITNDSHLLDFDMDIVNRCIIDDMKLEAMKKFRCPHGVVKKHECKICTNEDWAKRKMSASYLDGEINSEKSDQESEDDTESDGKSDTSNDSASD